MTPEKTIAIQRTIIDTAAAIAANIKIAYPPKRAFKPIDRTPGKRKRKELAKLMMHTTAAIGRAQVMIIMAQPERKPNFKPGGIAMAGTGEEVIIMPDGSIQHVKPKIKYL